MKIERIYHPYHLWEDYINGMYSLTQIEDENHLVEKAKNVLSDPLFFRSVAVDVLGYWIISTKVNLTNVTCNRKAWLGQASCCYKYGVPERITRIAWNQLTNKQRIEANLVAEKLIDNWIFRHQSYEKSQLTIEFP